MEDPAALTDFLAANLSIETEAKQKLIEETDVARRVTLLQEHLNSQLHIADLQSKLRESVHSEFSDAQKRAYLREQLRAIQKELGEEGVPSSRPRTSASGSKRQGCRRKPRPRRRAN